MPGHYWLELRISTKTEGKRRINEEDWPENFDHMKTDGLLNAQENLEKTKEKMMHFEESKEIKILKPNFNKSGKYNIVKNKTCNFK
jgi:hypothetical protein